MSRAAKRHFTPHPDRGCIYHQLARDSGLFVRGGQWTGMTPILLITGTINPTRQPAGGLRGGELAAT